jgi:hypothetical protein
MDGQTNVRMCVSDGWNYRLRVRLGAIECSECKHGEHKRERQARG